ncbi:MAG: entericidin [Pseudomonadota bacterium]
MKTTAKAILALAIMSVLAACNTVQGVGKDITAAGKGVQDQITQDDDSEN